MFVLLTTALTIATAAKSALVVDQTPAQLPPPSGVDGARLPLTEQVALSTVRILATLPNEDVIVGTAFFMKLCERGEKFVPALVTNWHVVERATQINFVMTRHNGNNVPLYGEFFNVPVPRGGAAFFRHPEQDIDLAAMPMAPLFEQARREGRSPLMVMIKKGDFITEQLEKQLTPVEDVIMVGYPKGLWDSANNLPIVRRGLTATDPKRHFDGKPQFLIDAASFPGSSGSPVFLYSHGVFPVDGQIMTGTRVALLGVFFGIPQFTAAGKVVPGNVADKESQTTRTQIPMNLGYVVRAEKILGFERTLCSQ